MKYLLSVMTFISAGIIHSYGQTSIQGVFRLASQNDKPLNEGVMIKIYCEDKFLFAHYKDNGTLIMAGGGEFKHDERTYTEVLDFFTLNPSQKGKPVVYDYFFDGNTLKIEAAMHGTVLKEVWIKEVALK